MGAQFLPATYRVLPLSIIELKPLHVKAAIAASVMAYFSWHKIHVEVAYRARQAWPAIGR